MFRSPAVHTPQEGKAITTAYLSAALVVLGPSLRYVREWYGSDSAVLEFEATLDGLYPTHVGYVAKVIGADLRNLRGGYLLPGDALTNAREAAESDVGR